MKRIIISFILFASVNFIYGQMGVPQIVNDPTNLAKIKEVLDASKQQIENIKEQTKVLQDARQALLKVNREINRINTFKNAIEQQSRLIDYFSNDIKDVTKNPVSDQALLTYLNRMESYRTQILDNNSLLLQLMSDGVYQMSDYERIKMAKEIIEDNEKVMAKAKSEKKRYEKMNEQLEILKSLKNK